MLLSVECFLKKKHKGIKNALNIHSLQKVENYLYSLKMLMISELATVSYRRAPIDGKEQCFFQTIN